ncbi:unnamed protein product [Orchesella dallaii]|uniref:Transferrin-like domain-containing protein n=1 Tax=Orchesella dallaii TaxID=48710 RepID=A0ABP1QYR7_9HEXA
MTRMWFLLVLVAYLTGTVVDLVGGQGLPVVLERDENIIIWCTINAEEQAKCEALSEVLRTTVIFDDYGRPLDQFRMNCTQTFSKDDCMIMLDNNYADITSLDPGEVFMGGRYHSLVPILKEMYSVEGSGEQDYMYAVAIIPKNSTITQLSDIRGKRACFAGVATMAGWVLPIDKLMKHGGMEIADCNNHVKNALEYFGQGCAVNSLSDKYNPLGDNSDRLCDICGSELPGVRCTSTDPYAGYEGAIGCLLDRGEIAFVNHMTPREYFAAVNAYRPPDPNNPNSYSSTELPFYAGNRAQQGRQFGNPFENNQNQRFNSTFNDNSRDFINDDRLDHDDDSIFSPKGGRNARRKLRTYNEFRQNYELLCLEGSRRDVDDWKSCNWGRVPAHAVVTSSVKSPRLRLRYQRYLQGIVKQFGPSGTSQGFNSNFNLMESAPRYGNRTNLLLEDSTQSLQPVVEHDQTYIKYLKDQVKPILEIRSCPVDRITLCVTSEPELLKCIKMRTALNAQLLKPEMSCHKAHSHINCMQLIKHGDADAAVFDAGDIYTAGLHFGLIPVMQEVYNTRDSKIGEPEYYAVAVAYQGDPDTELTYLKGKYSCHSGINHAAGWIIPMAYLISSGRMRNYGCDAVMAASQYFTKSCVPGALSNESSYGTEHNNLCDLCRGQSYSYCSRDASEDFYGFTGAFRCLVEGGGQVAFVKHTTIMEATDGKRRETWARNTLSGDYELLCRDGTRAPATDYERCNLGKVEANAVVVRPSRSEANEQKVNAIINLFLYAQQLYGRKYEDDFSFAMFFSPAPYSDLIFQDAAQRLQIVPEEKRNYRDYLRKEFLKARALVDCHASAVGN